MSAKVALKRQLLCRMFSVSKYSIKYILKMYMLHGLFASNVHQTHNTCTVQSLLNHGPVEWLLNGYVRGY